MIFLAQVFNSDIVDNPATYDIPSWATSSYAYAFYLGFIFAMLIRLVRVGFRWFVALSGPDRSGSID